MKNHYLYKTTIYYCPVCGKETSYKERQYTSKPEKDRRIVRKEQYDYCEDWD